MFIFAISYLTISNIPWFMDLTFQVPMQYCSTALDFTSITSHIHNWTLFSLWFSLFILSGIISPFFSSNILGTYWHGSSSFSVLSFHLFIQFTGFSRQEYWSGLPFPSPVDHVLSEFFTLTHLSWVALHSMARSFTELCNELGQTLGLIRDREAWHAAVYWVAKSGTWLGDWTT